MNLSARRALRLGLLVLLCTGAVVYAAPAPRLSPQQRVAAVVADLDSLTQDVARLSGDLKRIPVTATALPATLASQVRGLRPHWQAALEPLKGLPWRQVEPVIPKAQAVLNEIGALERDLAAWEPAAPPATPVKNVQTVTGTGAISGLVWDVATGQPMAHVTVQLRCSDPYTNLQVLTDANGDFLASDLPGGVYNAMVILNDYIGELYDGIQCGYQCYLGDGSPITVTEGVTTAGIDFPMYHFGTISGTVTDVSSGTPQAGIQVILWIPGGDPGWSVLTDGTGVFVSNAMPGTYRVSAGSDWYRREVYDGIPCDPSCNPDTGTPVTVAAGEQRSGIDFALERKGTISGTVADAVTGAGIAGVEVVAYDASGFYAASTQTDGSGNYATGGLLPGTHFVATSNAFPYANELFDNIQCPIWCDPTTGTPVAVAVGSNTAGINFSLPTLGALSGTLTDRASAAPVQDALVSAVDSSLYYGGGASSDALGHYLMGGLAEGTYFAITQPYPYLGQLFHDLPCYQSCDPTTGTPIAVTLGAETSGIDFALDLGGSVSGHVTSTPDATPLPYASVTLFNIGGTYAGATSTDASGTYTIVGMTPGSYFAVARLESEFAPVLYDKILCDPTCTVTAGTPIPVTIAHETTGIDFSLPRRGWISGTVTDSQTGLPLAGIYVTLFDPRGIWTSLGTSDASGHYSGPGTPAGTYFVVASDWAWPPRYVRTLYKGIPCPDLTCDPTIGTPVPVTLATETPNIDFALPRYGTITGFVGESLTGAPIQAVTLTVFDATGTQRYQTGTDGTGTYTFLGLDAGVYYITTSNASGYLNEVYNNIECEPSCTPTSGTPIVVTLGAVTQGVDFYLHRPFFADVPRDHWARAFIEALYADGVTAGCATEPLRFCPATWLTRESAAVLLLKSKDGPGYQPPPAVGIFQDVPPSSPYAPWIEELAHRGITAGCSASPPLFCPDDPFTRRQAAVLLLKTRENQGYVPPPAIGMFQDVPPSSPYAPWIEELAHRGITAGCSVSPPLFCPDDTVDRAQGAVFLVRTFSLPPVR